MELKAVDVSMNPKIKELMIESGMIAKSNLNGVMWTTNMSVTTAEKFAELIVKECSKVAMDNLDCPASAIETHFGVE